MLASEMACGIISSYLQILPCVASSRPLYLSELRRARSPCVKGESDLENAMKSPARALSFAQALGGSGGWVRLTTVVITHGFQGDCPIRHHPLRDVSWLLLVFNVTNLPLIIPGASAK